MIGHGHHHMAGTTLRRFGIMRCNRNRTALGHGVPRIDAQIEQRHFQLPRIAHHRRQFQIARHPGKVEGAAPGFSFRIGATVEALGQQIAHTVNQGDDGNRLQRRRFRAAELQEPPRQHRAASRRFRRIFQQFRRHRIGWRGKVGKQFQRTENCRQQIIEIMGDTAGERTERAHLVILAEPQLHCQTFGHIAFDANLPSFIDRLQLAAGATRPGQSGTDEFVPVGHVVIEGFHQMFILPQLLRARPHGFDRGAFGFGIKAGFEYALFFRHLPVWREVVTNDATLRIGKHQAEREGFH